MRVTLDLPDEIIDLARTALARGRNAHLTPVNTFGAPGDVHDPTGDERPKMDELLEDFVVSVAEGERTRAASMEIRRQVEDHRAATSKRASDKRTP